MFSTVLPLEFEPVPVVLRLAAIGSASLLLLVPLHAARQLDVDPGWGGETKAFGEFNQIELMNIEDAAERVRGVGLDIRAVAVFC